MSIRLRTVNCVRVALCAVEADPMPEDLYLDDADHHALTTKFALDFGERCSDCIRNADPVVATAMATQKMRDAKDELEKWIAAGMPPEEPSLEEPPR